MGEQGLAIPMQPGQRADQQHAHQARVKMCAVRAVLAAQAAGQNLKTGVRQNQQARKEQKPAEDLPAGPNHQQHAQQAGKQQQPAQARHLVFEQPGSQRSSHQGREHHHGGKFAHRDVLQRHKSAGGAGQHQRATQQLKAGVSGFEYRFALHGPAQGQRDGGLEGASKPQQHHGRREGHGVFGGGVENRKRQA